MSTGASMTPAFVEHQHRTASRRKLPRARRNVDGARLGDDETCILEGRYSSLHFIRASSYVVLTFRPAVCDMDALIRGTLTCRVANAHDGQIHNVSVPVDSGDDAYEALSRAVENALGGEKIVLYGPPWRASTPPARARRSRTPGRRRGRALAGRPRSTRLKYEARRRTRATRPTRRRGAPSRRACACRGRWPRPRAGVWCGASRRPTPRRAARRARGRCSARSATSRRSFGYGAPRARRGVDDVSNAIKRIDRLLDGVYVCRVDGVRGRRQPTQVRPTSAPRRRARTRARASASARRSATSASGPRSRRSWTTRRR